MKKILLSIFLLLIGASLFAQVATEDFYGTWVASIFTNDGNGIIILKIAKDEFIMETIKAQSNGTTAENKATAKVTTWFNIANNDILTRTLYPYGISAAAHFIEDDATLVLQLFMENNKRQIIWAGMTNYGMEIIFLKQ